MQRCNPSNSQLLTYREFFLNFHIYGRVSEFDVCIQKLLLILGLYKDRSQIYQDFSLHKKTVKKQRQNNPSIFLFTMNKVDYEQVLYHYTWLICRTKSPSCQTSSFGQRITDVRFRESRQDVFGTEVLDGIKQV